MMHNPLTRLKTDSRGQILLLAAIALVIIVLGTATLLNLAAFTEINRADGVTDTSSDALHDLSDTENSLEVALQHANHDPDMPGTVERSGQIEADIEMLERGLATQFAREGGNARLDRIGTTEGVRVWQSEYNDIAVRETDEGPAGCENAPGGCPDPTPSDNFGMYNDADNTRAFTMHVTDQNLNNPGDEPFRVEFDNHGNVYMYAGDDPEQIVISDTADDGGEEYTTFANEEQPARIDFTGGTINEDTVTFLPATEDISGVGFDNGEDIHTSLNVVVSGITDEDDFPFLEEQGFEDEPEIQDNPSEEAEQLEAHDAVYSVTVDVAVRSQYSDITTTIRVTPGLPLHAATGE